MKSFNSLTVAKLVKRARRLADEDYRSCAEYDSAAPPNLTTRSRMEELRWVAKTAFGASARDQISMAFALRVNEHYDRLEMRSAEEDKSDA